MMILGPVSSHSPDLGKRLIPNPIYLVGLGSGIRLPEPLGSDRSSVEDGLSIQSDP